jgi:hypothetical protein
LPILVAVFGYSLRRAVGLNLSISLVTVLVGVTSRIRFSHGKVFVAANLEELTRSFVVSPTGFEPVFPD